MQDETIARVLRPQRSMKEIIERMTDEQRRQYDEYAERYCENKECDRCKRYLKRFEEKFINGKGI